MRKIRKGDEVIVTAGKDKGRRGSVLQVLANDRILVDGINVVKKHTKPNPMKGDQGGIVEKEMPLHISNVMVFNSAANKGDRIGIKTLDDGKKVRYFKSNGEVVDV
jgi:large subunit ribosomal protein L24